MISELNYGSHMCCRVWHSVVLQEREHDTTECLDRLQQLHDAQEHKSMDAAAAANKLRDQLGIQLLHATERNAGDVVAYAQIECDKLSR